MRREEWNRGGMETEGRDYGRDPGREYDRDDYRGYENRGGSYGRDYEMRGRNDRDTDRNFGGRERGYGRDFDEDRGFGYGRMVGGQGTYGGFAGGDSYGPNWEGRNYSQSGYGGSGYSSARTGAGYPGQQGAFGPQGRGHMGYGYGQFSQPGYGSQLTQPFYGQRSDQEIEHEVYDRLDDDWQIPDNADIRVQVQDGVVTLTGQVRNRNAKMAAWNCVWNVAGVEDVHNNIQIQSRRRQSQSQGTHSGHEQGRSLSAQGSHTQGMPSHQESQPGVSTLQKAPSGSEPTTKQK